MKKVFTTIAILVSLVSLVACGCKHEWTDATCTNPQKCIKCNITNGEPLGHTMIDATCQKAKHCSVCGVTEGTVSPHNWIDATCSAPQTCTVCNVTEGEKLPHTPTDTWVTKETSYVYAETVKIKTCTICGEEVDREITKLKKLHDGKYFEITPEEYVKRFGNVLDTYTGNSYTVKGASTDDSYACGIVENGEAVCILIFNKNGDMVTDDLRNDRGTFNKLLGQCDEDALARVSCAMFEASDPTISLADAKEYAKKMLKNDSVTVNGVKYIATKYSDGYIIGFTID